MSLKEKIKDDIKQAMRDKNESRVGTLRLLSAAIQRREVDERIQLDDTQVMAVIEKLVKQGRESIELYVKGGRQELADKESAEIAVFQAYLPQPLSEGEIDKLITEAIASTGAVSVKDMGKVMGVLKPKLQGRADMGLVGGKVKAKLGTA
ncbi:MAG: GatB/YqeY domain-containing protein [Gammaproteobacteria bacterium]|nr:GatB/YqeY domain-containing protein [Gammaproteobacteria bacterium]MDH3371417.1 GatB/YqeY domain-containing protein [Gammaproteobacteria bacterium]MDH3407149.1 GatB/YqeY domain-containing protein [Gammaproteobacteria bacterium]MDH5488253.1 GatB/YqeY domain-containing protein [Gammaproteobacteria bacterium]